MVLAQRSWWRRSARLAGDVLLVARFVWAVVVQISLHCIDNAGRLLLTRLDGACKNNYENIRCIAGDSLYYWCGVSGSHPTSYVI